MPLTRPSLPHNYVDCIGKRPNPRPPKYMWLAKEQFEKQSRHLQLCFQQDLSRDSITASRFLTYDITQK